LLSGISYKRLETEDLMGARNLMNLFVFIKELFGPKIDIGYSLNVACRHVFIFWSNT